MNFKPVIALILIASVFTTCDKIDDPFAPDLDVNDTNIVWDDSVVSESNKGIRFVLLEEFTGHTCKNCPDAAREAQRLKKNFYGDSLVIMAIHATGFAIPKVVPGAPTGSFQTDHQTDEGSEYVNEQTFGIFDLPKGMINRVGLDGNKLLVKDKWKQKCDEIFKAATPAIANIEIRNLFDDSSKTFKVKINVIWFQNYYGNMNLQVQILEDNIINWQDDEGDYIPDYVFNHMFRGSVNTTWGSPIDSANAGETSSFSYTRKIETYLGRGNSLATYSKPDFSDFSIVAFIYKQSPDFEVMQVNTAHLTHGH